jgi:hypothetical protein
MEMWDELVQGSRTPCVYNSFMVNVLWNKERAEMKHLWRGTEGKERFSSK